jgi:hypothetical protein
MLYPPNNLVYPDDHLDKLNGAMVYIPDCEIYEGMIWLISPRRTYAIIMTEDDEWISFSFNDLTAGDPSKLKQGYWVLFEKCVTEYRTTAVNVRDTSALSQS